MQNATWVPLITCVILAPSQSFTPQLEQTQPFLCKSAGGKCFMTEVAWHFERGKCRWCWMTGKRLKVCDWQWLFFKAAFYSDTLPRGDIRWCCCFIFLNSFLSVSSLFPFVSQHQIYFYLSFLVISNCLLYFQTIWALLVLLRLFFFLFLEQYPLNILFLLCWALSLSSLIFHLQNFFLQDDVTNERGGMSETGPSLLFFFFCWCGWS